MNSVRTFALVTLSLTAAGLLDAQVGFFTVTPIAPIHGKVQLTPALPADGKYPAGTVVTLTATPWIPSGTPSLDSSDRPITRQQPLSTK